MTAQDQLRISVQGYKCKPALETHWPGAGSREPAGGPTQRNKEHLGAIMNNLDLKQGPNLPFSRMQNTIYRVSVTSREK